MANFKLEKKVEREIGLREGHLLARRGCGAGGGGSGDPASEVLTLIFTIHSAVASSSLMLSVRKILTVIPLR